MSKEETDASAWEKIGKRYAESLEKSMQKTIEDKWVGLTDEEITEIRLKMFDAVATNYETYRAIEAKLKEKNNG